MAARSDAERRVAFLLRCADAYALASPEAARHFAQRARELANERGLRLDEATRAAFCAHCSTALVPGVNCAVRVTAKWRDDPSVRRATRGAARPAASRQPRPGTVNLVAWRCFACGRVSALRGTPNKTRLAQRASRAAEAGERDERVAQLKEQASRSAALQSAVPPPRSLAENLALLAAAAPARPAASSAPSLFFAFQAQDDRRAQPRAAATPPAAARRPAAAASPASPAAPAAPRSGSGSSSAKKRRRESALQTAADAALQRAEAPAGAAGLYAMLQGFRRS